jgi:hypothetical protein
VPLPSHDPPQADPSLAHAGRAPWGAPTTGEHVPADPATSQAWHCPPQAVSQHTPSAQKPLPHSPGTAHGSPGPFCGTHEPLEQKSPGAQSRSAEHDPRHAVAPQTYGAHACVCAEGQWPPPSQAAASVATPAAHDALRQLAAAPG